MARKTSKAGQPEKQNEDRTHNDTTLEKKPEKVALGDTASMKRLMDDAAAEVLRSAGYQINHIFTDFKIVLGLLACTAAAAAQFWPGKYPGTFWVLVMCVIVYVAISTALSIMHLAFEKDTIVMTYPVDGQALIVRSKMPRFQETYTLGIRPRGSAAGSKDEAVMEKSIGAFFDRTGVFVKESYEADVADLLSRIPSPKGTESKKLH